MNAGTFSKILVAIDGSEISLKAADYGITMEKKKTTQNLLLLISFIPLHLLLPTLNKPGLMNF